MTLRQHLSNLAHRFGHWVDPAPQPGCVCRVASYMTGWRAARAAELRGIGLAKSPDEMDRAFRALIAASERGVDDCPDCDVRGPHGIAGHDKIPDHIWEGQT